jgi:2-polyprenyl-6-methoxyphenol hydroxylase-like FAD-dependent oxidoreductase
MADEVTVRCCIAGGGPAGMMLGHLLARAGVDVLVLEKHADFLRDFRGDTIHPSTLELMHELGALDDFLKLPHQEVRRLSAHIAGEIVPIADFGHLPTHCRFVALMPQWDFLNFLAARATVLYPAFRLWMRADVTDLIEESGRIVGLRVTSERGPREVRADLVVGADGRRSLVRARAGLPVRDLGAPMDVLWFRLSRKHDDPGDTMGYFDPGRIFITINRGDYWQCGHVIPKGQAEELRRGRIEAFRERLAGIAPFIRDRVGELRGWGDVNLLTVTVDRLERWHRPGLLCIGDAAHAMSPIGGVGINLAVQDAVAAANLLAEPLRAGRVATEDLARVERRRLLPTCITQWLQVVAQRRVIAAVLGGRVPSRPPLPLRLLVRFPLLRRIPARLVGMGIRPEHIHTPERRP